MAFGHSWDDFAPITSTQKFLGGNQDPARDANKYYDQIPGKVSPYYDPYINAGQDSLHNYQNQLNQLTNNPSQVYNLLGQGYQQSPGYQFQLQQGLNASNNAAAAGGMAGSPAHQYQNTAVSQGLASQDFNNYLGNMFNLYNAGLSGTQGLQSQGLEAGKGLGDVWSSLLSGKGNMAYTQAQDKNQQANQLILGLIGATSGGMGGGGAQGALSGFGNGYSGGGFSGGYGNGR